MGAVNELSNPPDWTRKRIFGAIDRSKGDAKCNHKLIITCFRSKPIRSHRSALPPLNCELTTVFGCRMWRFEKEISSTHTFQAFPLHQPGEQFTIFLASCGVAVLCRRWDCTAIGIVPSPCTFSSHPYEYILLFSCAGDITTRYRCCLLITIQTASVIAQA